MQALAGGAARVGGREGAAAARTKPAAAADGTVMLLSLGLQPGPQDPLAFAQSPAQPVPLACWEPSVLNPLLTCWHGEQGSAGRARASPAARSRGSEGTEQHPSQGTTPAPTRGPPWDLPGRPGTRQVQCRDPDPAPARAAAERDLAGNSWVGTALLVITN